MEHHGYAKDAVMILEAKRDIFKTEDILETIKQHGHEIAVVLLPGKLGYQWVMTLVRVCRLWPFVLIFAQPT